MFPAAHGVVSQGGRGAAPPLGARGGPSVYLESGWSIISLTQNVGWRFKVGANDITITHLRYHNDGPQTETVRLYRASDGALLRSAPVTTTGGWAEEPVTPVTLTAGHEYVIAHYAGGSARNIDRTPTTYQLDPAIEYISSLNGATDAMPAGVSGQRYFAAAFRTQAAGAGYRFYRLKIESNNGGGTTVGTHELGLRESLGGASVAVGAGGAATASGGALPPAAAFDGLTTSGNGWADTSGGAVNTKWLMYDFGSAKSPVVVQYTVASYPTPSSTAARSLNSWTLQGSNDLDTWDDLDVVTGETGWTLTEERVFTL